MSVVSRRSALDALNAYQNDQPAGTQTASAKALVGFGFRCWMRGAEAGDYSRWEMCWNQYATTLGPTAAERAVRDLASWVKSLRTSAGRRLQTLPYHCAGFCRDECLAISMIAAGQQSACPVMRACAYALLESNELDRSIESGTIFAQTLSDEGIVLGSDALINAAALVGAERSGGVPPMSLRH